ncbi:MAG: flagellar basal body-associated FliL family protein [Lachnospiraceae bacterium]|nr:flagellar basal body-associated FliL family protein [Lachnospiraceae bacterium]
MKRNLLSIVILVLVLINTILNVIMMVSLVGTANKTSALINGISSALSLEVESQTSATVDASAVPMTSIDVYSVSESMTIPLKKTDDKDHYCLVEASFSINKDHEDYATYGSDLSAQESLIKDQIRDVISQYTVEEAQANQEMIKQQILERVQALYDSDFIFNVSFGEYMFQ